MKHYTQYLKQYAVLLLLIVPLMAIGTACSDDDDDDPVTPTQSEADMLVTEIEVANGDYMNTTCPSLVTAQMVYEDVTGAKDWYVIDIRAADDYNMGHVPGAVNVARADIFTHMASVNAADYGKIVIICYSGQSAAWTTALLRLSGVNNVASMKFGMSSWHSDFDRITSKCTSDYINDFVTTAAPDKPALGELPNITTGKSTGAEILMDRIAAVHAEDYGAAAISAATVMATPDQYYVINYWTADLYTSIGHMPGSYQYTPKTDLKLSTHLKSLPTDKTIAVYCFTGQTSANVAAILRVMGYDAKSISFGTQGMIWQKMVDANKTAYDVDNDCMNFTYEK